MIICPRGFAKTTAVSKIMALWLLVFELEPSILVISSRGLGETIIGDIRRELEENDVIRTVWGELVPIESRKTDKTEKWRQTELQLLNGTEIKTLTKGQAVRGQRPTMILIDDPEENKDVKNPIMAEQFFNWVFTSLYNALDDGGSMIVLGTIISTNCFVNRLKQEALERSFTVFEYPSIQNFDWKIWQKEKDFEKACENASSLWPAKWSMTKLKAKFRKIKEKPFFQEFMNIPFSINGSPVFQELSEVVSIKPIRIFGSWSFYQEPEGKNGFLGVDVANGSMTGDFSVINVRDEQFKLIAQYRAHISQDKLAEETDWLVRQLKDCFIVPENNIALAYIYKCREYEWARNIYTQRSMDRVTMRESETIGWNTNAKTKILLITNFRAILEKGLEVTEIEKEELENYFYDEKGGMNAISPHHDDTVIADALSCEAVKNGLLAPIFATF